MLKISVKYEFWAKTESQDLVCGHITRLFNNFRVGVGNEKLLFPIDCVICNTLIYLFSRWSQASMNVYLFHGYFFIYFVIAISVTQTICLGSRSRDEHDGSFGLSQNRKRLLLATATPKSPSSFHPACLNRKCPWLPVLHLLVGEAEACHLLDGADFLWLYSDWPEVLGRARC